VVVVGLPDADIRQLADVEREAEIDDRGLEVDRQAAVGRKRVDVEAVGRAEVRLQRLDRRASSRFESVFSGCGSRG
jgi:hypothetical protein